MNLCMIALVPQEPLRETIKHLREEFAGKYNCKAALKPPVHITLVDPFEAEEKDLKAAEILLLKVALQLNPFQVPLHNYKTFNRGVVYIHAEPIAELKYLRVELISRMRKLLDEDTIKKFPVYTPHLTIGYRDIPKHRFEEAAMEYASRKFSGLIEAEHFELWQHDGNQWQVRKQFFFAGKTAVQTSLF